MNGRWERNIVGAAREAVNPMPVWSCNAESDAQSVHVLFAMQYNAGELVTSDPVSIARHTLRTSSDVLRVILTFSAKSTKIAHRGAPLGLHDGNLLALFRATFASVN